MIVLKAIVAWLVKAAKVVMAWAGKRSVAVVLTIAGLTALGIWMTSPGASRTSKVVGRIAYAGAAALTTAYVLGPTFAWIAGAVETVAETAVAAESAATAAVQGVIRARLDAFRAFFWLLPPP